MREKKNTAVLLINLGTPDSTSVSDVRSYLSQFLNDARVIDLPWMIRKFLVNVIIVPFRAPKSAAIYRKLWTDDGSPLLFFGNRVRDLLQKNLPEGYQVFLAMRYKNPSIAEALRKIKKENFDSIIVLPLFPQYASATTGSVHQEVMRLVSKWWVIPEIKFISQYYDHPLLIEAFSKRGRQYNLESYDHILFSYHGLPERQVDKVYEEGVCSDRDCENEMTSENKFCYKATCYATTRLIVQDLNIPHDKYTVCFQSRLDKNWLTPFSDQVIIECAKKGMKKLLVFSPAFTADCLETLVEIGDEYQALFVQYGGEKIQLVEGLNDDPSWIGCLKSLALSS